MADLLSYFTDFFEKEDSSLSDKHNRQWYPSDSDHMTDDLLIKDYTKLYKIPKYLETVSLYSDITPL